MTGPRLADVVLPTCTHAVVFHVGTLPGVPTHGTAPILAYEALRSYSQEGPGLSVSRCPDAWTRIARLGGATTYALRRADGSPGRFLDVRALAAHRDVLLAEAATAGLLERTEVFLVEWFDDELEERCQLMCADLDDAIANAPLDDAWPDADALAATLASRLATARTQIDAEHAQAVLIGAPADAASATIFLARRWAPTARLADWWGAHFTEPLALAHAEDAALAHLVEHDLADDTLDGLWWDERYAPVRYSAPRGVIVPRALPAWQSRLATPDDARWIEEDEEDAAL